MRINPLENPAVISTTLALIALQEKSNAELPDILAPDKDTVSLFSAAYVALRKEDFSTATTLIQTAEERLPHELFTYFLKDPALSDLLHQPEFTGARSTKNPSK